MPTDLGPVENRFLLALSGLEKARKGVAAYAAVVVVFTIGSFFVSEPILLVLVRLLGRRLVAYDPSEGFLALLSISVYCGLILSIPVGAWLLWRGAVAPRVPGWKRWGGAAILAATALFASGVLLGYFVLLPAGVGFLVGFESGDVKALISARRFVSFCGTMLVALGVCFEAPLVSFFLARIGWLRPAFFRDKWRHAVVGCVVAAAVLTPTPDVYNLTLMSLPLLGLYFVSYIVVWAVDRTRTR